MLGFGAVIPILPVYLHEQMGASTFVTGLLIGLSSGFALAGRLFAGRTADRKGRRTALILGLAFSAAAGVLYLIPGIPTLAIGRVLHGLGEGFFITGSTAWVVDIAPETRRGQALGFLSSGIWGGVSVGPAIGQALGTMNRVSVFLLVSSLAVIAMSAFTPEEKRPHHGAATRWFPKPVLLPGIILGFGNVTYAVMSGFLILLLRQRGLGTGIAFSAFALAVLLGRAAFGGLPDRMGPRRALYAGYILLAIGLVAIALTHNNIVMVAAAMVVGVGYAFPWPALAVVVVDSVRASERALALGALTAFYDLFVALSSAVAGAVAGHWGLTAVFWMALGCVGCAAITATITDSGRRFRRRPVTSTLRTRIPLPSPERCSTSSAPRSAGTSGNG